MPATRLSTAGSPPLQTAQEVGLSSAEAARRLRENGPNELTRGGDEILTDDRYAPPLQAVFGTAAPPPTALLLLPFPFAVWSVDELWRRRTRP